MTKMYGHVLVVAKGEETLAKLSISLHVIQTFYRKWKYHFICGKKIRKKKSTQCDIWYILGDIKKHVHGVSFVQF